MKIPIFPQITIGRLLERTTKSCFQAPLMRGKKAPSCFSKCRITLCGCFVCWRLQVKVQSPLLLLLLLILFFLEQHWTGWNLFAGTRFQPQPHRVKPRRRIKASLWCSVNTEGHFVTETLKLFTSCWLENCFFFYSLWMWRMASEWQCQHVIYL